MINLRKIVGFLMVLMLAAFALPSGAAQQKLFNAVFPTFTSSPVTVTFNNTSPGNSTINSLSIALLAGGNVTITQANCAANSLGTGTLTGGACIITGFPGILSSTSKTFQLPITIASNATCANATWVVNANTGNTYPQGTPFTPVDQQYISSCDGTLACYTGTNNIPPPDSTNSFTSDTGNGLLTGIRYPNKDGSACVGIAYDFTNFIVTNNNTIHQVWDTNSQPNAVFTYAIPWKPVWADPVTGLPKPTQVAWNTSGLPQYVDARFCLTTSPPTSLGTLPPGPDVTATQTQIAVSSGVTFSQQFAIVIDTERMNVTAISPGSPATWTVQRHVGGTAAATHTTTYPNSTAKNVMNAPLPLDGAGNQMHMCILEQDVTTVLPEKCVLAPPPTNPPPACLQVDQILLDEGDGWSTEN